MSNEFELDALLKQMAEGDRPVLPGPGLIWWRAQILRKQQEKQRIERPLVIMRGLAAAACVAAFVFFLTMNWGQPELPLPSRLLLPLVITVIAATLGLGFLAAGSALRKTSGSS